MRISFQAEVTSYVLCAPDFVFLFSTHFIELQLIVNDADNEKNKLRRTR